MRGREDTLAQRLAQVAQRGAQVFARAHHVMLGPEQGREVVAGARAALGRQVGQHRLYLARLEVDRLAVTPRLERTKHLELQPGQRAPNRRRRDTSHPYHFSDHEYVPSSLVAPFHTSHSTSSAAPRQYDLLRICRYASLRLAALSARETLPAR
jgi:hypothetical protein